MVGTKRAAPTPLGELDGSDLDVTGCAYPRAIRTCPLF